MTLTHRLVCDTLSKPYIFKTFPIYVLNYEATVKRYDSYGAETTVPICPFHLYGPMYVPVQPLVMGSCLSVFLCF
jgi:hypothetical protein